MASEGIVYKEDLVARIQDLIDGYIRHIIIPNLLDSFQLILAIFSDTIFIVPLISKSDGRIFCLQK